jgi:molybdopterin-containing oxidoreductase family iron-sulfur binding subunit
MLELSCHPEGEQIMKSSRRGFFKLAGISLLGFGAKPVIDAIAAKGQPNFSPGPKALQGKRWAMLVDLKKVSKDGFRDCIEACHRIHNVPKFDNPKDEVKWIWDEPFEHAFPGQGHPYLEEALKDNPIVVLCNHCDNPPCVRVCPTKATFKREEDGIVMMDYHRCIGCRFCMAGCPYGARSLNWRDPRPFIKEIDPNYPTRTRGVVEKCNFCAERLAKGLIPACVEASKDKALVFGDLEDPNSEVRELLRSHHTIRRKPQLGTMPQVYYIV